MNKYSKLLEQVEAFEVNPAEFGHQEHIQVAYEMLLKYGFLDASTKYAKGINTLATNAGVPDKFNMTITLAFLSLIAKRLHGTKQTSFEEFLAENRDLLSRDLLSKWYSTEQLNSDFARTHFLLPNMAI